MEPANPRDRPVRMPLKGLSKCQHEITVRVRDREVLGPHVEKVLFRGAEVLCEGSMRASAEGKGAWFGSIMITVDLADLARWWRGPFDQAAQERLLGLLEGSVRVRLHALRLASPEVARRLPGIGLGTAHTETRMRIVGARLHLDVDLEVPIGVCSRRRSY